MAYKRSPYKKKRVARRGKRGFGFDVSLGKNVPFFGGSSLRLGTRAVKSIARREINRQEETKEYMFTTSTTLLGNTGYTIQPVQFIAQGLDDNNRTGKKIFLRHLTMKGNLNGATPSILVRFLVLWGEKTYTPVGTAPALSNGNIGTSDLFLWPYTNPSFALLNNKIGNRVICDKTISMKSETSVGVNHIRPFKIDCPIFSSVQYKDATVPTVLSDKQLYVYVIAYSPGVTSGNTTNVVCEINGVVTFKDA